MEDSKRTAWRSYSKSSMDKRSDGDIRVRLRAVQEHARNALRKTRSDNRTQSSRIEPTQNPQQGEKESENEPKASRWTRSLSSNVFDELVKRLPTWKIKTRTARASVQGYVSGCEDSLESREALKRYFELAMASNADDFKQQQEKIIALLKDNSDEASQSEEMVPTMSELRDLQKVRRHAEALLRMYKNRTNARWVEREEWVAPTIVDPRALMAGAVSLEMHKYNARQLLADGRVALMLIDDGAKFEISEDRMEAVVTADLWQVVRKCWPNKIPQTHRIEGLSMTGRRLLQMAVVLDRICEGRGLSHIKIILAVNYEEEVALVKELCGWGFFGFSSENVVIVTIPCFPGIIDLPEGKPDEQVPNDHTQPAGDGYAMLLLNSPAEGYTVTADGREPTFLKDSVLEWLEDCGVHWLLSGPASDIDRIKSGALEHALDLHFIGATLYAEEYQNCKMAMEVIKSNDDRDIRFLGSLVLSRQSEPQFACNLKSRDLQTPATYQLINSCKQDMYISNRQYLFNVPHLRKLLTGPAVFHPEVDVQHSCYAYIRFDMADITAIPNARCLAVLSTNQANRIVGARIFNRQWVYDMVDQLEAQDSDKDFRSMAIKVSEGLNKLDMAGASEGGGALGVVLPVDDSIVSKMAMRLGTLLITKLADRLHVAALGSSADKAETLLEVFKDKELDFNQQIKRCMLDTSSNRPHIATLKEHLSTVGAQLLILGADELTRMGSFVRHAIKNVMDVHILVVKSDSLGQLFRAADTSHLKVMAHVENNPTEMIQWLNEHLKPGRDKLQLARSQAFDKNGKLSMTSRRILANARLCADPRFDVEERTYKEPFVEAMVTAVANEQVDLLVVSAALGLEPPRHVFDIVVEAKTSILIFRSQVGSGTI